MLKIRFKNNKYNAVWLVEPRVTIGSSRRNDLVINDTNVADEHLEVLVNHEQLTLKNLAVSRPVHVNNEPVHSFCELKPHDIILIGSTELQVVDPKREVLDTPVEPMRVARNRPLAATGWSLKSLHPALNNRVYSLKESNLLGRSSECDITLAAAHLSRRHARLDVVDGVLYVKDLGSANGTFINGKPVREARVRRGDELKFDTVAFGVIGPPDEFAKTSVRRAAFPADSAADNATKNHPILTNAPENQQTNPLIKKHKGPYSMAILIVLAAVIVLSLYLRTA
ncbi:FHA domain-containing protein [Cellvibrio polysaccharolyticus]|uniref:FHA domain-containing protein n=1 Tax=Cellvibrio polysaccharolyticus TaxID=2082724 RepID=A0A928YVU0_9GAMM|nr:FHA domain-containing protein [Cellvibrio polysaccharolyticus]MBE8717448.1 FHA domain-containing protein [Cellvibrio polysaccharolyticus]